MHLNIKKILVYATLLSIVASAPFAYAASFSDIPYSHPHSTAISYLESNNIVQGYDDNTFRPTNLINRVEFLKIVLKGTNVPLDSSASTGFTDIDENQWYGPYIKKAKEEGWVQGYPDNTFKPLNPINKVEALKILGEVQDWDMLALGEVPEAAYADTYRFNWYSPYVYFAKENNLLFEETTLLEPAKEISREYMAELMYRSIVANVILYKPGQTAEDIINEATENEIEIPEGHKAINVGFFENILLNEPLPNTFFINEVYIVEGEITDGNNYQTIFSFLAPENGDQEDYKHHIGEISGNKFKIPIVFRDAGEFQLGIIPGSFGESKIHPIRVLDGIPVHGEIVNNNKPDRLNIEFENDTTSASWNSDDNVFRVYFFQDDTVHSYLVRDTSTLNLFYKDFKNFEEGDVTLRIYSAKASLLSPLTLETQWNQSADYIFNVTTHHYQLSIDESITYSSIPEKLPSKIPINVSGSTKENIFTKGAVITPSGLIDTFIITTTNGLIDYYGNDVIPANSTFNFSYSPSTDGTYILEINNQGGSAVLNIPVYIGNITPLIPDFFDLQNPFETTDTLNLTESRNELLNYINVERAVHGLSPVSLRADLNDLSQDYSDDMVARNFFSHIDPDGGTPDTRRLDRNINIDVGENLANAPSVYFAHKALMRSAIHRENILNPEWNLVGLGITLDGFGDMIIVEEFSHNFWNSADLERFENNLLDKINGVRNTTLSFNSTLRELAREWSQSMIDANFFSFISPSGINLIEEVQNRGVTNEGRAFILKEGTLNSLFEKLLEDSDIENSNWKKTGLGIKQDSISNLYLTVIYTE